MEEEKLAAEIMDLLPFNTMVVLDKEFKEKGVIVRTPKQYKDIMYEFQTSLINIHKVAQAHLTTPLNNNHD